MDIIIKGNQIRFIYTDELYELTQLGKTDIKRVSHVEPCEGGWKADMSPVNGPILGPYKKRSEALRCELEWLANNGLPHPLVN